MDPSIEWTQPLAKQARANLIQAFGPDPDVIGSATALFRVVIRERIGHLMRESDSIPLTSDAGLHALAANRRERAVLEGFLRPDLGMHDEIEAFVAKCQP